MGSLWSVMRLAGQAPQRARRWWRLPITAGVGSDEARSSPTASSGVINPACSSPRSVLCFGQWDELLCVPRHGVEAASRPLLLGLLDPLGSRGHEIPPDIARPSHRRATKEHKPGVARGSHADRIAGSQHQQLPRRKRITCNLNLAGNHVERALLIGWLDQKQRISREMNIRVKRFGRGSEWRTRPECLPCDQSRRNPFAFNQGQLLRAVMHKGRVALLLLVRKCHPGLNSEQALSTSPAIWARALGMHDASGGPHPIHRPRFDGLFGTKAVAVKDLALKQIDDSREVDVWVRTHVNSLIGQELGWAHLI